MKQTMKTRVLDRVLGRMAAPLAILSGLGVACDEVLEDPSFDLWCGDTLCKWEEESGRARRASTWHERDYGVRLSGTPAAISQRVEDLSAKCLSLELVGKITSAQELSLELDYLDDGTVEDIQRFPAADWEKLDFTLSVPDFGWPASVRVRIKKNGPGDAVLARLSLHTSQDCSADPPELLDRPRGFVCGSAAACAEGLVCALNTPPPNFFFIGTEEAHVCGECARDEDCGGSLICGHARADDRWYRSCIEPRSSPADAGCLVDDECESNLCCLSSVCATPEACDDLTRALEAQ